MVWLATAQELSHEEAMPEQEIEERRFNSVESLHRDLGRMEGRVGALEQFMNKFEHKFDTALEMVFSKLNKIQSDLSEQKGQETGKEKSNGNATQWAFFLGTILVSIGTAVAIVHFGK